MKICKVFLSTFLFSFFFLVTTSVVKADCPGGASTVVPGDCTPNNSCSQGQGTYEQYTKYIYADNTSCKLVRFYSDSSCRNQISDPCYFTCTSNNQCEGEGVCAPFGMGNAQICNGQSGNGSPGSCQIYSCGYGCTDPSLGHCSEISVTKSNVSPGVGTTFDACNASGGPNGGACKVSPPPSAPTVTTQCSNGNIIASWNAVPTATDYVISVGDLTNGFPGGDCTNPQPNYCFNTSTTGTSYTYTFGGPNHSYSFSVKARNSAGTSAAGQASGSCRSGGLSCNSSCTSDADCARNLVCVNVTIGSKACRTYGCTEDSSCPQTCSGPVSNAPQACNGFCNTNADCQSGLVCSAGNCRNSQCSSNANCTCSPGTCPGGTNACGDSNYGSLGSCAGSWSYAGSPTADQWCQQNAGQVKSYCYTCGQGGGGACTNGQTTNVCRPDGCTPGAVGNP